MKNKEFAIILLGGKSSRLNATYNKNSHIHKSLLVVNKKTILEKILTNYIDYNINNFILAIGYKGKTIRDFILSKKKINGKEINLLKNNKNRQILNEKSKINIILFQSNVKDTKYDRIKKIINKFNIKSFHLTYGDGYANINIKKIINFSKKKNTDVVITSAKIKSQYGHIVRSNKTNKISIVEKPLLSDPINIGYMFFNNSSLKYFKIKKFKELENELLNFISKKNKVCIYHHQKYWKSIDNFKDLQDLRSDIKKINEK